MRRDPSNPKYMKAEVRIGPIIKVVIRIEVVDQTVETGDSMEIIDLDKAIETTIFKGTLEDMEDKIVEENIGIIGPMIIKDAGDRSRERTFSRNSGNNRDRGSSNSRPRSGSRASTNRDKIRCYNCREYNHFARDCPNSREERDLKQLQQMLNMEAKEKTHLLTNRQDSPTENYRGTTTFLPLDSRIGGQGRNNHPTVGQFLTREQRRYIYRKVETGEIIKYRYDKTRNRARGTVE